MSEYIKREDAIDVLIETITPPSITLDTLIMRMNDTPSADVVEIVWCKDCKNYEHIVTAIDNEGNVTKECDFCNHWKRIIDINGYCSYGVRKEHE